jgi:cyanophycin synthetase
MKFQKILALRGPNIWAHFPVLEAWVDLGELKDSPSDELPGFNSRLMAWLPSLIEHRCSVGTRGGFFDRLHRGTWLAHILEHVALELQSLAGTEVGFGRTRETSKEGVYKVALEYEVEDLGRATFEVGRELCLAAVHDRPFDVEAELHKLRELCQRVRPTPDAAAMRKAARERGIPVFSLGNELLQLGHGARQRRVLGSQTDRCSAIAESIARDNELTLALLREVGVPVPPARLVRDAEDAWTAAREVGLPVVLRRRYKRDPAAPSELLTREEVQSAYETLSRDGYSLMVAHRPAGTDCRLVVVGDRIVSALSDGLPVPPERVHPEVGDRAIDAARVVGLDVAGIDIVARDLSVPLEQQGGVVVGVDPCPDALPLADALLDEVFPDKQPGRIPIVAVTGVNGKTTTTRLITFILERACTCVGMTCTEGIYIGDRRIEAGDCSGPLSAKAVLGNPRVTAAVLETARGGILRAGLGFDRCDVAVVTNIGEGDHLGIGGIDDLEQLARVKRTIVDVVSPNGWAVLKADDPLVAAMADACPGGVVLFGRDGEHPAIVARRQQGGRGVFVRGGRIILAEGRQEIPLVGLDRVPLTHGGRVGFQVDNALAAAAAAWSLGVPCEVIHAALESFSSSLDRAPARFNLLAINGATVVLDYGHNASSLSCLLQTLEQFPHAHRSAVYSAAGDRRDSDVIRQGELLGDAFDRVILYEEEHCVRGRKDGEIIGLFRRGLTGRRRATKIEEVRGALTAVESALDSARPGELLLVQVDRVDETIHLVRRYLAEARAREIDMGEALDIWGIGSPAEPGRPARESSLPARTHRGPTRRTRGEIGHEI